MGENEPRAFSLTLQKNHLEGDFEKLNLRSAILKLLGEKKKVQETCHEHRKGLPP